MKIDEINKIRGPTDGRESRNNEIVVPIINTVAS
jgi:hypothetical protein